MPKMRIVALVTACYHKKYTYNLLKLSRNVYHTHTHTHTHTYTHTHCSKHALTRCVQTDLVITALLLGFTKITQFPLIERSVIRTQQSLFALRFKFCLTKGGVPHCADKKAGTEDPMAPHKHTVTTRLQSH
jgi:hypothetical protein